MHLKKILLAAIICFPMLAQAQPDFCAGVNALLGDAALRFKNTKGAVISASAQGLVWDAKLTIPGTIKSRLVSVMGLYYEGAFFQTKNPADLKAAYGQYKTQLAGCLTAYKITQSDNFYKGLESYKKLIFTKPSDSDLPPPHVSMEVDYNKTAGLYTIVVYVWEH
jgi:hypothetical protein